MDPKELKDLSQSHLDRALEAIDQGHVEEAKKLLEIMKAETKHCHDLMVDYVWTLLTYIGKNYGEEEVYKALEFRHGVQKQVAEHMLGMTAEDSVRFKAKIHRGHHSTFTLEEEPDRYVMKLDPCNTGGRMLRLRMDQPPIGLLRMGKAHPWTWSKKGVSYYCAHCAMHEIQGMEKGAPHPTWVFECPENPDDPCIQYCYKHTEDVPEEYFSRIGKRKPK
jgi:hypothetical protein